MNDEELQGEFLPEEPPKKSKKPADPKLSILMLQLTACLILAAAAVCIRFFGGALYGEVREKYISMFEDTTTVQEVMSLMKADSGETASGVSMTGSGGVDVSSAAPSVSSEAASSDTSSATTSSTDEASSTTSDTATASDETSVAANALPVIAPMRLDTKFTRTAASIQSMCLPTDGFVSSEYGWRDNPVTGEYLLHAGIDIAADTGEAVYAALAGEVITAGEDEDYGIYVVLRHAGGLKTLYAHLSETLCAAGDTVQKGEIIALVGSTGRSTGPHLHFEVQTAGGTVNPRYLLPAVSLS